MNTAVVGLQWGDEGKGKAIDYLAKDFSVVVRYQGGHNAGHTIYHQGERVVLHLLPSGIFYPQTISVIANGVVVNPVELVSEIKGASRFGINLQNLFVSARAPLILPFHQQLDIVFEESRPFRIGTTRRGIGPAYEDLCGRRALVVQDLLDKKQFALRVKALNDFYNQLIPLHGGTPIQLDSYLEEYVAAGQFLKPMVTDTTALLNRFLKENRKILYEGAQGTLLDLTLGTYPYVTSSHPTVGGILVGTGLSHKGLQRVVGITKAYTTRVGEGPFPTELDDAAGVFLRERGSEYGATTGRPRRVGWLDLVALTYAVQVNGVDAIFLTKLDVLGELDEIKVAVAYRDGEGESVIFKPDIDSLSQTRPVYKSLSGWKKDISGIKSFKGLPDRARRYILLIEDHLQIPVQYISTGSGREQTILRFP